MDPQDLAGSYIAGRAAAAIGEPATSNPHHDWERGVAWAAGWHHVELADLDGAAKAIEWQTAMIAGELWG